MKYFRELPVNLLENKIVVLDIDGTITYDKDDIVYSQEFTKLEEIKKVSKKVFLVSNGEHNRTNSLSEFLNVLPHTSNFAKPHKKVLENIIDKEMVVIGDKFLTDGLLSIQHGLPFIHVKSLQRKNESFKNKFIFFIDDVIGYTYELFRLMRPKQWIKNFLVFAPVFFAGDIFNFSLLFKSFIAFIVFSFAASLIYILNDATDATLDRLHHKKRWRPIASFNISENMAYAFFILLYIFVSALLLIYSDLFLIVIIYVFSNLLYTLKLKNIPIFDVVSVASMYVLRVLTGGIATGLFVSPWIIVCTFFAALFLISCKRYIEFQNPIRSVLKKYSKETLQALLIISATLSMLSYVLYTILGNTKEYILYTGVFVITVFLVMLNDVFMGNKKLETPEIYLVTNRHILYLILAWIFSIFIIFYNFL